MWKNGSDFAQDTKDVNEWGEQRKVTNQIKKEIFNMREMLKNDGFPDERIDQILGETEARYKNLVEKVSCRLYTYGEKGRSALWLVPWCFDKIRKFKQERQCFKYYNEIVNNHA